MIRMVQALAAIRRRSTVRAFFSLELSPAAGLVEEQQHGIAGERPGDLDQALVAVREAGDRRLRPGFQPHEGERRPGAGLQGRRSRAASGLLGRSAPMTTFFEGAHGAEQADVLEGAPDPGRRPPVRGQARDVLPGQPDGAAGGAVEPERTLSVVVLPEPFGPISAWIPPRATVKLTASTALRPPKCLASPETSSIGAADASPWLRSVRRRAARPTGAAQAPDLVAEEAPDPVRHEHHDQDHREPVDREVTAPGSP